MRDEQSERRRHEAGTSHLLATPGQLPVHVSAFLRRGGMEAMWRVRVGAEGPRRAAAGASKAERRAGTRDGERKWPEPGARSQDVMKPREVRPRRRHQGRQATEQFQPGEEEMRGAVRQRALHPVRQAAVLRS
jgi:hypothetical protein